MIFSAKSRSSRKQFQEKPDKTYILPTTYGILFGLICLILLAIGFATSNNAVYFICFLMAALASQSLVVTNRMTDRLQFFKLEIADHFADEDGTLVLGLENPSTETLRQLTITTPDKEKFHLEELIAQEKRQVRLPLRAPGPGAMKWPRLETSSDHPYGFARSWKKSSKPGQYFVYPARRGDPSFAPEAFQKKELLSPEQDDFKGHRDYRDNDSPRAIDWKVSSRLQKLSVKEFEIKDSKQVDLRWQDCPQTNPEDKKCQLSLWIDRADKMDYEYSLEIPGHHIHFGKGPQHKQNCLRAL